MDRTYPHGVPCWVDTGTDVERAAPFYAGLFGWELTDVMPADVPGSYLIATLDGADAAALGTGDAGEPAAWNTFVAVDDADVTAAAVTAAGGTVLDGPADAGPGGRAATCLDPSGARFFLWQPRRRLGAQVSNAPGSWNFSHLRTDDPATAMRFYGAVFGWEFDEVEGIGISVRVPGYGRHLADTVDPGIYERQAAAPAGFEDVVAGIQPLGDADRPHWHVQFTVADRDAALDTAAALGGQVLATGETAWTREAQVRDPAGAVLTLSQFTPPS